MKAHVIHTNRNILGGTPVFWGTRVPVKNLFDYLKAGDSVDDFLLDFPTVAKNQVVEFLESASKQLLKK
mgnify:CR=1 FL=1